MRCWGLHPWDLERERPRGLGRTWGHGEEARPSGKGQDLSWGGFFPACLLCLMGRPSHNSGAMLELGTSSGLLHRNPVTGVTPTPPAVCTLVCGLTLLFFQIGPVAQPQGARLGDPHPAPTPPGGLTLPLGPLKDYGGPRVMPVARGPSKGIWVLEFSVCLLHSFIGLCWGPLRASHICPSICPWSEVGAVCE